MRKFQLGYASRAEAKPEIFVRIEDGIVIPLSLLLPRSETLGHGLLEILEDWHAACTEIQLAVDVGQLFTSEAVSERDLKWLPPIVYPRKLICIGTNYHDHMQEMGITEQPAWPYSFLKPPTTTLVGSGAVVAIPHATSQPDW